MTKWQLSCSAFLLVLATLAHAQIPAAHQGELSLDFAHDRAGQTSTWFVDYVVHSGEPAFRLLVHHFHADCSGYIYVGKTRLAYVPITPGFSDGFDIARSELKSALPRYSGYSFSFADRTQQFAFLSEPTPQARSQQNSREQLMFFVQLMMTDFDLAQAEFGRLAAGWQQSLTPSSAAGSSSGPPTIKIFSPAGAADGGQVDAGSESLVVIGLVAQPTPVRAVLIDGQPVPTQQFTANIVEFKSPQIPLQAATRLVNLLTICDSGQSQITFIVKKPVISFVSTSLTTADPTVSVKGTLTGYGDIERLELGGKLASLSRQTDDSIAFATPDLPVNPGRNTFQGTIISADGVAHPFSVIVERRPRLSFDFVRRAIRTLSRPRLTELIDEYGVDFRLDEETTKQLRASGADQNLLDAIRDAAPAP